MSLSVLEAMSILQPIAPDAVLLPSLPGCSQAKGDEETKFLHKMLDTVASLVKSSSGTPRKQACAVSLSLGQSSCMMTIAFDFSNERTEDVRQLMQSIWRWMKEASVLPEESAEKNQELFEIVFETSLNKFRRRLKEKGWCVDTLITKAMEGDLSKPRKDFLLAAESMYNDLLRQLDVDNPDFTKLANSLSIHVKNYASAKSKMGGFHWLRQYERQIDKPGVKCPGFVRYMDKLLKPYNQYTLFCEATRKPFIRTACSFPLTVTVLPPPDPPSCPVFESTIDLETRVRLYLKSAIHSYSPAAANSSYTDQVIDEYWQRIQQVDRFPPPLGVHCECTLLRHHLNPHPPTPYPYIGVSRPPCFQCALYFQAYRACADGGRILFWTRVGPHGERRACALPTGGSHGPDDAAGERVVKEMGIQLAKVIGYVLTQRIETLLE
ncbi:hypothetical protein R3P38DRAFT_2818995 [Favolaschia claudopus]|uniref:Uncharacterized protein n=1 Tax=Favolaschia claudopus TaxID=2862362 RepID=A0AAW0EGJ0_9AGAR